MKLQWKNLLKIGVSIFILYLCIQFWPAIGGLLGTLLGAAVPLFIGGIIAYVLNILMSAYEKVWRGKKAAASKLKRPVCLVGALLTLIAIVGLVIWLVVPQLISCFQLIFAELPGYLENVTDHVRDWGILPEDIVTTLENADWQALITQFSDLLTS